MKNSSINPAFLAIIEDVVKKAVREAFADHTAKTSRLTTAQTMATLACHRTTLWRLTKEGKLTPHKGAGRSLTYDAQEVLALRDSMDK